jgi:uncharacterized protein (TIGR03435 family)
MRIWVFVLAPLFCAAGLQTSEAKLEFEVASVKPSAHGPGSDGVCRGGPGYGDPALFICRYVELKRIIRIAFGLRPFQVAAPDWTQDERFDIQARVPSGATKEQFKAMLQNLLIERFHLAFHRELREMTIYELLVAEGGPKLKEAQDTAAPPDPASPNPTSPDPGGRPGLTAKKNMPLDKDGYPITNTPGPGTGAVLNRVDGRTRFYQPHGPVEGLLPMLEMTMDQPVVDATGLKGTYEIELHWVGESLIGGQMRTAMAQARANTGLPPDPGPSGPTIQQALRDQLGLKLELKKGPVETLVVDRADKVPTEN